MEKVTFREAQLMCLGVDPSWNRIILNNLQEFKIGDSVKVVEISLTSPSIVISIDDIESYCQVENFSDAVIDECIRIMEEVALEEDSRRKERIKSSYTVAEIETIQGVTANCYKRAYDYYEDFFETLSILQGWALEFESWWKTLPKSEWEEKDYLTSLDDFCEKKLQENCKE